MSSMHDDFCEELWERAKEYVAERMGQTSYCDRPSQFWIDKMIEEKYQELLESSPD
jgi:hypothetical protein